ncbi:energy transducer TonB [Sphingomonas xinjiangensis]|uniref:Protein TonB n=1 Tax=Sphingomonas xinjiangensis TaxID=643568 RepID=A0A840YQW8_9SPHN|nr:energy transducer TonB [Sphingomonas xinjiangensis]MBB5711442.1 protein TonB [Sphingomonas xinjiangensis]
MPFTASSNADRTRAALGASALTVALGAGLIWGLAVHRTAREPAALAVFQVPPAVVPPEKPKPVQPRRRTGRPEGEASPPNLRAEPTEVVAPTPVIPLPVKPPVVAAPIAGTGAMPSAGSADIPGPGFGSGGVGKGRGSGGAGDGDGDGGGREETPPEWVRGRIRDSDFPDALAETGIGGTVGVRYTVWTDGRVVDCEITKSSGSRLLDATTCRLIRERFRFRPSRDRQGRAVAATIVENHSWMVEQLPPDPAPAPRRRRGLFGL